MVIGKYSNLPNADQLSFIKLLIFIEGLEAKERFNRAIERILNA